VRVILPEEASNAVQELIAGNGGVGSGMYALLEEAPAAIAVFSGASHRVLYANTTYARVSGRKVSELLGRPLAEACPELVGSPLFRAIDEAFATGVSRHERELEIVWDRDRNGKLVRSFFDWTCQPLHDARGVVLGTAHFFFDVTETALAQLAAEVARREAEAANRSKDEFLALLGHELRNPLAPMITALQLMRLRGTQARDLDVLERQVGHLVRLVDDLLDVSRITRGKVELRRHLVEIADVVARAIETTSPLLEQRRHVLDVRVPKRGLCVDADADRLVQVVSNLLTNAAKYSNAGSRVSIRAERAGDVVRLSVKDEGIGIPSDMLGRIFDAFVQNRQSLERSRGGLGLGLTIVRSLVELHGGSVEVKSEGIGKGSEFVVELPASDTKGPQSEADAGAARKARPEAGKRVLVVDDNHDAAATLKEVLEELGYTVETAHDGPSAINTAKAFQPEIGLLDIGLPVMDGYELAQRLRAMPGGAQMRLVAVTGYGQETDRQRSRAAGFDQHLVKPVDLERLHRVLKAFSA
jgi:signal transduction histidine kinase